MRCSAHIPCLQLVAFCLRRCLMLSGQDESDGRDGDQRKQLNHLPNTQNAQQDTLFERC